MGDLFLEKVTLEFGDINFYITTFGPVMHSINILLHRTIVTSLCNFIDQLAVFHRQKEVSHNHQ